MAAHDKLPFAYRNKRLFSPHYLDERLPKNRGLWATPPGISETYERLKGLYESKRRVLPNCNEAQTEDEFIRPLLDLLGFHYVVQSPTAHGTPDYALFSDEKTKDAAYSKIQTNNYADAVGVADAKYWERPLDVRMKDSKERVSNVNPNFQIINYLTSTQVRWGILTNGRLWRLYSLRARPAMDVFYEVDIVNLMESEEDLDAFKYFLLFFRKEAFVPDAQGKCFLDTVFEECENYRATVEEDVRGRVHEALRALGEGFAREFRAKGRDVDEAALGEIYRHSLILMYRILFILYAEDRDLLPMRNPTYRKRYSFAHIKHEIQDHMDNDAGLFSEVRTDYYDNIRNLCRSIHQSDPSVEIPPYNGGLFNPDNYSFLDEWRVGDAFMARAIDMLARREVKENGERRRVRVDYRDLSERQLGSIYEILLEFHLVPGEDGGVDVRTDKGERKATGSYYTPDYVVKYIVESTLGPLVKRAAEKVKEAKGRYKAWTAKEKKLALRHYLDVKALDPAMGSGHFLVRATEFIAEAIATDPELDLLHEDLGVEGGAGGHESLKEDPLVQELKRLVVENCIFGVDMNGLAVELAKLSLWLSTLSKAKPLNFLDHHLKRGNSLVGARLHDLAELPVAQNSVREKKAAYHKSFAELEFERYVDRFLKYYDLIEGMPSDTVEQVHEKECAYEEIKKIITPFKHVADVWTTAWFGSGVGAEQYRDLIHTAVECRMQGISEIEAPLCRATEHLVRFAAEQRYFHWEIEFPEIFFGKRLENPGFDAVIGNPPYDVVVESDYDKRGPSAGCGNLFGQFIVKGADLAQNGGLFGFIVPLSFACGDDFEGVRRHLYERFGRLRATHYSIRPAKIFPNVDQRVTIFIASERGKRPCDIESSRLYRFHEGQQANVVLNPALGKVGALKEGYIPRVADDTGASIYHKFLKIKTKIADVVPKDKKEKGNKWYFHSVGRYWMKAYDFVPYFSRDGADGTSTNIIEVKTPSSKIARACVGAVNSNLFYFWWILQSDEFHLLRSEIFSFPLPESAVEEAALGKAVVRLMKDYQKNAVRKTVRYKTGTVVMDEIHARKSAPIIQEIDEILAPHYGLTKEELQFLLDYDRAFRHDDEEE